MDFPRAPISAEHTRLIGRYRLSLERRGVLASSIEKIRLELCAFARWLEPDTFLLVASREQIETFLDQRRTREGRQLNSRTRYHWITNLHGFFDWAVVEELIEVDPTVRIVRPKQRRVLPRPIGDEDLELAVRTAPAQMRAMLMLAAFTGLRCKEIAELRRDDVIEAKGLLRVVSGKGDKERIVPLHPDVLEALQCVPMPKTGIIFVRPRGGKFSANWLSATISRYLHEHGIDATAHRCRHWFGTSVYEHGHDLRVTQELLGHSDPSTTAGYVAYSHVNAAAAVASLSLATSTHETD